MMRTVLAATLVLLAGGAIAHADSYTAISTTAAAITGDIEIDETGITFENGETLAFSGLEADSLTVDGAEVAASVYRVETPRDPVLENGNNLCGIGDVTFIAVWEGDYDLTNMAVFTGETPPQSDDDLCASYAYEKAGGETDEKAD